MKSKWKCLEGSAFGQGMVWCGVLVTSMLLMSGCATVSDSRGGKLQVGESLVLAGEQPGQLAFPVASKSAFEVRSTYRADSSKTVHYEAGRDYVMDMTKGQISRTPDSRIPDFRTNMLFGVDDFDHSKYPGFGNRNFFVFVDYKFKSDSPWPVQALQGGLLPLTRQKLAEGRDVKIVAYGDSITFGGDATEPSLVFWERWAESLRKKYPKAKITTVNGATGGDATRNGLDRLEQKVLSQKPDLVLLGFGMNDHNIGGFGTPLEKFSENLGILVDRIRKETGAEIVMYSTFPPNPKWHYGSKRMEAYAEATRKVAEEKHCAFADIYNNWNAIAWKKKPEDMLANNVNHPNDFGHWIYFRVLEEMGL